MKFSIQQLVQDTAISLEQGELGRRLVFGKVDPPPRGSTFPKSSTFWGSDAGQGGNLVKSQLGGNFSGELFLYKTGVSQTQHLPPTSHQIRWPRFWLANLFIKEGDWLRRVPRKYTNLAGRWQRKYYGKRHLHVDPAWWFLLVTMHLRARQTQFLLVSKNTFGVKLSEAYFNFFRFFFLTEVLDAIQKIK